MFWTQTFWRQTEDPSNGSEQLPGDLRSIFAAYGEVTIAPEASSAFMPGVWTRIDARRKELGYSRLARGFVTAAGAICLALGVAIWTPLTAPGGATANYVDALAADQTDDMRLMEIAWERSENR